MQLHVRPRAAVVVAALAMSVSAAGRATAAPHSVLPFVEDNYAKALAQAKAQHKPLFIDAWAPW